MNHLNSSIRRKFHPNGFRSWLSVVALGSLLALFAGACSGPVDRSIEWEGERAGRLEWAPDDDASLASAYDFVERFGLAMTTTAREVIVLEKMEMRPHLVDGWALPRQESDIASPEEAVETSRQTTLFGSAGESTVRFHLRERGDWTLTSFVPKVSRRAELSSPFMARVTLNGLEVWREDLRETDGRIEVELPTEVQRVGENLIGFAFEGVPAWNASAMPRQLNVPLGSLSFSTDDTELAERRAWIGENLPEGSAVRESGAGVGAVWSVSGCPVSYYLRVPQGALLRTGIAVVDGSSRARAKALFRVSVTREGEAPQLPLEVPVTFADGVVSAEASLADFAGEIVRLDLEVTTPGETEPVIGGWFAPGLWVPSNAAPRQGVAGSAEGSAAELAALRRKLAGAPVVCVLMDACNAEYLGCHSGLPGVTPNVDRLADEGTLFENAHSVASYTVASVGSMMTGRFAWEHRAWRLAESRIHEDFTTWAEQFQQAGYRTAAVVCSGNGASRLGFDRGFEEFSEHLRPIPSGPDRAEQLLAGLGEVLDSDDERPLFLWLHMVEPHRPYTPPQPFAGKYSSEIDSELDGAPSTAQAIRERDIVPDEEDIEYLRAVYSENLSYGDDVVARIRGQLEAAGIFEDAIVCLFSDHGEGFCEHESRQVPGIGHGTNVYEEMTRIPLVFRLPAGASAPGRRVPGAVSGLDILPTLADLVGVQGIDGDRGVSLAPAFVGALAEREPSLAHSFNKFNHHFVSSFALWDETFKLVLTPGGEPELFDLASDPGEKVNLAKQRPILTGYLVQRLSELSEFDVNYGKLDVSAGEEAEMDLAMREHLRELGYLEPGH